MRHNWSKKKQKASAGLPSSSFLPEKEHYTAWQMWCSWQSKPQGQEKLGKHPHGMQGAGSATAMEREGSAPHVYPGNTEVNMSPEKLQ